MTLIYINYKLAISALLINSFVDK